MQELRDLVRPYSAGPARDVRALGQRDVQRDRVRHRRLGQRRREGVFHFLASWMDSLSASGVS